MSRVCVLGEIALVEGFTLAGAEVAVADTPDAVRRAWHALPDDTGLLVLTPAAAAALSGRLAERPRLLWVVLPR